ncbi:hypothetical protein JXJ21_18735 [candidate division KSB1 bacterium]|nr:hypothetical protein [candidate division KSB1 bacterium]
MSVTVELLVNPFCMADRDSETVTQVCAEAGVTCRILNIWEIYDPMDDIPPYVSTLVREYRTGERPGSVYSSVFVNGERLLLNKWSGKPTHLEMLKDMIAKATEEAHR